MPETHEITATEADHGQRVDRFLAERIGNLSRSRVKALIEDGHVTRDGEPLAEPAQAVRPGSLYRVAPPPPAPARPAAQAMALDILYEDAHLIVLDKPAGLVVHPAPGNLDGTLVNALLAHAGEELEGIGGEKRPGIVHRLDKDTSGIMVVAKTQQAHQILSEAFAARDLDREYLALVWGLPKPPAGEIEAAIGRHATDRKRMAVVEPRARGVARGEMAGASAGKHAVTRYSTEQSFHGALALMRCKLMTGRTHQIRVHLAHIGHPLVGDPVYLRRIPAVSKTLEPGLRDPLLAFPRQALHATSLGFVHPVTRKNLSFRSAPPEDFARLLAMLGCNTE
ncbi:RluA family pseudouridine synthase [Sediminicoccus sp. KRV36]|uniref:RluA family pseudouridine synthase n=1 Tax=Sediminicoccus sp. KRV36 TaxID=3133721 RepID=UPI00200DD3C5|nr:RluA family pseudouridine synthase [Sediminicoccus rosea]UPY38322.1 RluA family pseudouridine synthase [Sediminicoccus rosea]